MSELLRLHDWLCLDDAVRFIRHLGISADKDDFFNAYRVGRLPLRIACHEIFAYSLIPDEPEERGYPHSVHGYWNEGRNAVETDAGAMVRCHESSLRVAEYWRQGEFSSGSTIWVMSPGDDVPFDESGYTAAPLYWDETGHGQSFFIVTWGLMLTQYAGKNLLFSRPDIETLVRRAKGEAAPEHTAPAAAPSASQQKPYLNPSHESYPPELAAAIMLWEALYIRGEKSQHHLHTQAAKAWLEKNWDRLPTAGLPNAASDAMISRLSTITAPADRKPKK